MIRHPPDKEVEKFFDGFKILDAKPTPKDLAAPPDWREYKRKGSGFRALMPPNAHELKVELKNETTTSVTKDEGSDGDGDTKFTVITVRFVAGTPEAERVRSLKTLAAAGSKPANVKWGGRDAEEMSFALPWARVVRLTQNDTTGYAAIVQGGSTIPDPLRTRLFLDSFVFDKE